MTDSKEPTIPNEVLAVEEPGKRNAHFGFSPRILDHLGISAYNSVQKCLSELAANSHDADATEVHISLPDTLGEDAVIEIADNGVGMSPTDL